MRGKIIAKQVDTSYAKTLSLVMTKRAFTEEHRRNMSIAAQKPKSDLWKATASKNRKGRITLASDGQYPNTKYVMTPLGKFSSITEAGAVHNVCRDTIRNRTKSKPNEYYFLPRYEVKDE